MNPSPDSPRSLSLAATGLWHPFSDVAAIRDPEVSPLGPRAVSPPLTIEGSELSLVAEAVATGLVRLS